MYLYYLAHPSVRAFKDFMMAIAENDLWDEVEQHLLAKGCKEILISEEPINAIQELMRQQIRAGRQMTKRGRVVPFSAGCKGRPPEPPRPTPGPENPEPPGGKPPGPPTPELRRAAKRGRRK